MTKYTNVMCAIQRFMALTVGIFLRELQMNSKRFGRGGTSLPQDPG